MSWLSDVFSGGDGDERTRADVSPLERARQLLEGVESSAAAMADEHRELARRSAEAAQRLTDGVGTAARGAGEGARPGETERASLGEALERLDRLHFALLQVAVQDRAPEEAGAPAAVEAVEELAGRLEGSSSGGGAG